MRITSYTERPQDVGGYGAVSDETGEQVFELEVMRTTKAQVVARIPGVADRDAAEALRGTRLFVPRDRLPPPEPDEFYNEDLVGAVAETAGGAALGRVVSVQDFGAGALLEIAIGRGRTVMVPFTREAVPQVDVAARRVVIDPPAGLLDEEPGAEEDEGRA